MKKIVQIFFVSFLGTVLLWSCKKDEDRVVFTGGTRPILTSNVASGDTILLTEADSLGTAVVFSWTNPNYQFSNGPSSYAVSYDIQIDTLGGNFSDVTTGKGVITISPALGDSILVKDFNNVLASASQIGLTVGKTYTIQVRVKSYYSNPGLTPTAGALDLYSDTLTYVVTPYKTTYPTLWVPGQYQSWTPLGAPTLALSPFNATSYEGYVWVPIVDGTTDNYDFKLTSLPSFSGTNYGISGTETGDSLSGGGALSTSGSAGNLSFGNYDTALTGADYAGYYLITANIPALTWTYQRTVWTVIGSFAASNWNTDIPMTYDPVRQELYSVITFTASDQFKFRANGNYTINFGLNASNNLAYNGSNNITVAASGVDTVFLNLAAGNYTYSVVPQ